jgi:ABC-2 type transport system permease protein
VSKLGWVLYVYAVELKKAFAYRADFWVQVVVSVLTELAIAYFLWSSIFAHRGVQELGGYTFPSLMLYYLLGTMTSKVLVGPEYGFMSTEIYEGSLTRYLVYPVSFFIYKFAAYLAKASVAMFQMLFMLIVFAATFGLPEDAHVTIPSIGMGLVAISVSTLLYFSIASILEMVSFWADNVWSLMVMLRFTTALLGGAILPLTLFPEHFRAVVEALPFHFLVSFPVGTFMGRYSPDQWALGLAGTLVWSCVFLAIGGLVWRRGTIQYSGVGV